MKKVFILKIITIIIITIVLQTTVLVTKSNAGFFDDWFGSAEDFIERGSNEYGDEPLVNDTELKNASSNIFMTLYYIGMAIALAVGGILGIKFMVASADDKAKIKETMVPYIAGCVVLFGAFTIWRLVVIIVNNIA